MLKKNSYCVQMKFCLFFVIFNVMPVFSVAADLQSWITFNGVRVYFFPTNTVPMVNVRILVDAGGARAFDRPGVSRMTSLLLAYGSQGKSADEIAEKIESVGTQYSLGYNKEYTWLNFKSLTALQYLNPSIDAIAAILSKPNFSHSSIELVRKQMLAGLQEVQQSPGLIARRAFNQAVFENHPYGVYADTSDLMSITQKDVINFYHKYYVTNNTILAIVGKLSTHQAKDIANELVAELPSGKKALAIPPVKALTESKTIRIRYPSKQTHILMGQPGYARTSKDHYALSIANHHFGGGRSTSLLYNEIREQRGLVYSIKSVFSPRKEKGAFYISLKTKNSNTTDVLALIERLLNQYVKQGISISDYNASVQNITGGFPLKVDTNIELVNLAAAIGFYGLSLNYLDEYNIIIKSQSLAQVREAFRKQIDPNKFVKVIVGDE